MPFCNVITDPGVPTVPVQLAQDDALNVSMVPSGTALLLCEMVARILLVWFSGAMEVNCRKEVLCVFGVIDSPAIVANKFMLMVVNGLIRMRLTSAIVIVNVLVFKYWPFIVVGNKKTNTINTKRYTPMSSPILRLFIIIQGVKYAHP